MKKQFRLLAVLVAALFVAAQILPPVQVMAQDIASGSCGENLTWVLDENVKMTISGTGDMTDYGLEEEMRSNNHPWSAYRDKIKTLVIESGVTSIGINAFSGCTALSSVSIPDTVDDIGYYAFLGCTSVTIPTGVVNISNEAFREGSSLSNIYYLGTEEQWEAVAKASYWDENTGDYVVSFATEKLEYAVNEDGETCTVTGIGTYTGTDLIIPEAIDGYPVTAIGRFAFEFCENLTSVVLPDGVKSIGQNAFMYCSSLTSITIPDSVTSIGYGAFCSCSSLESIILPDSVSRIEEYLFGDCAALTSIVIPDSVTSIGSRAFMGCRSIAGITIPESVTSIGEYAFFGCWSLTGITIPEGVTSIESHTFVECSSLTSVTLPESMTHIGGGAFWGCTSLSSITIPEGVTNIGGIAFFGCTSLQSIIIPEGVDDIGVEAFRNCTGLTSVTIGEGVTSIGYEAFRDCSSLTSIIIPSSVNTIQWAFNGCSSLWHVLYLGSEEEWNAIDKSDFNAELASATIHYNCTGNEITDLENHVCSLCTPSDVLMGDVNGDGAINTRDAKLIMQLELGLIDAANLNVAALDVNGDGAVNTRDAKLIMQLELGLIPGFSAAQRKYSLPRFRIVAFR